MWEGSSKGRSSTYGFRPDPTGNHKKHGGLPALLDCDLKPPSLIPVEVHDESAWRAKVLNTNCQRWFSTCCLKANVDTVRYGALRDTGSQVTLESTSPGRAWLWVSGWLDPLLGKLSGLNQDQQGNEKYEDAADGAAFRKRGGSNVDRSSCSLGRSERNLKKPCEEADLSL